MTETTMAAGRPLEERPANQKPRYDFNYSTSGQCPSTPGASSGSVSAARWFLEQLFDGAVSPKRLIVILDKTTGKVRLFRTTWDAASYAMAAGENSDIYVGATLRQSGLPNGVENSANVTAITCLRLEVDMKNNMAAQKGSCAERLGDAMQFLKGCPVAPSIITSSGQGLQTYWLFNTLWPLRSVGFRAGAREVLHRWDATTHRYARQRGWQINSVWNLGGLIRIPGTMSRNINAKEQVRIIWPVKADAPARYCGDDIQRRVAHGTVPCPQVSVAPPGVPAAIRGQFGLWSDQFHGDMFPRLWNGQWSGGWDGGYPSWESAALGLGMMLAYRFGPKPPRIDAAFRASGLYRQKWDSANCDGTGETYGECMIRVAIARQKEFFRMPKTGGSR